MSADQTAVLVQAIRDLQGRVAELEGKPPPGAEALTPTYLTVDPSGNVGANFSGHVHASGLDLSVGSGPGAPIVNKITWLETAGGAVVAELFAYDNGPQVGFFNNVKRPAAKSGFSRIGSILPDTTRTANRVFLDLNAGADTDPAANTNIQTNGMDSTGSVNALTRTLIDGSGASSWPQNLLPTSAIAVTKGRPSQMALTSQPTLVAGWNEIQWPNMVSQFDPDNQGTVALGTNQAGYFRIAGGASLVNNTGANVEFAVGVYANHALLWLLARSGTIVPNGQRWGASFSISAHFAANTTVTLGAYASSVAGFGSQIDIGIPSYIELEQTG